MWWSKGLSPGLASGSSRPRWRRWPKAMPTADARPLPSGPVVISTPLVWCTSGWPGVRLPQVRSSLRSLSLRPYPERNSWMYWVRLEWPQERTKRSRPSHVGSAGSWLMTFWKSRYAAGASDMAVPGCPLPAFWTASAARSRTVSTARTSRSLQPALFATGRGRSLLRPARIDARAVDVRVTGSSPSGHGRTSLSSLDPGVRATTCGAVLRRSSASRAGGAATGPPGTRWPG